MVDSCGWLELLSAGPNAKDYEGPLSDRAKLIVPSICLQEVYRHALAHKGPREARLAAAAMLRAQVTPHDAGLAFQAAALGRRHRLAMADSIVYATARRHGALLWTQDADFKGLPGVKFIAKRR